MTHLLCKSKILFALSCVSIFLLWNENALGQTRVVEGQILSSNTNKPLSKVKIYIEKYASSTTVITNASGSFTLKVPQSLENTKSLPCVAIYNKQELFFDLPNLNNQVLKIPLPFKDKVITKNDNKNNDDTDKPKENTVKNTEEETKENPENKTQDIVEEDNNVEEDEVSIDESDTDENLSSESEIYDNRFKKISSNIDKERSRLVKNNQKISKQLDSLLSNIEEMENVTPEDEDKLKKLFLNLEKSIETYEKTFQENDKRLKNKLDQIRSVLFKQGNKLAISQRLIFILIGIVTGLTFLAIILYMLGRMRKRQRDVVVKQNEEINQQKEEIRVQRDNLNQINKKLEQTTLKLTKQNQKLKGAYMRIQDSINYASRIQSAVLAKPEKLSSYFEDIFVFYKPKDIVSGDFYWVSGLEDKIILVVGDCTGHGVPGAIMTILGNILLNQVVNERGIINPSEILTELDKKLQASLNQNLDDSTQDSIDASVLSIDKVTKEIKFASAKGLSYYIHEDEIYRLKGAIFPVGGSQKIRVSKSFETQSLHFNSVETLYLFSDGFQDQFGGEEDKKYQRSRFRQFLLEGGHLSMQEQKQRLEAEFVRWKNKSVQTDDVLVVGVKF